MSHIEAPSPPVRPRNHRPREAFVGFVALAAVLAAVIMSAVGILARDAGEPIIMLVLAVLAMVGVFFLFATAAGLTRFAEEQGPSALLEAWCEADGEGVHLVSPEGWVAYSSPSFATLIGATDLQDGRWLDRALIAVPGGLEVAYRLAQAAATRIAASETVKLRGYGGEERRLRISVSHLVSADGEPLIAWRVSDLERQQPGETPSTALEMTLTALDALPVGAFLLDATGRFHVNPALAVALGAEHRSELQLTPASRSALADALAGLSDRDTLALELAFASPAVGDAERGLPFRIRTSGVGAASLSFGVLLETDANPHRQSTIGTVERFFDAAPIAIATVDADGRIGQSNGAFDRMFGKVAAESESRSLLALVASESRDAVKDALKRALETAAARATPADLPATPVDITFGDGGRRNGRLYASRSAGSGAENTSLVLYAIDTTEQKELEAQFAQAQKMQAIGELAGGIAHDFRNALMVIIGFSDLLLANHRPNDPAYADIMAIKQNATRTAGMVHQLLAFSRRQTLRPEIIALADVLSNFKATFARVLGEQYKLSVEAATDLWPVKADATQLDHVIMNLAVNARDAMPKGGQLTIAARNLPAAELARSPDKGIEPGDYVLMQVSDTGSGMPPDVLAKIFQPFFTTKEVGKGTGLGLSMVYGIIKQTDGYIYCDSIPDVGTTFRIYLPRHAGPRIDASAIRADRKDKDKPRDLTGTGTVLLVEDEEEVRRFAKRALERQGFTVLGVSSGREALDTMASVTAEGRRIDIVVSDIVMPEMDGPTLLREIRKTHPELRIIFMSGYAEGALDSLDDATEYSFLSKPVQMKELVEAVKDGLRRS